MDATIIVAPSSTKNSDNARDPERHEDKKGDQWHFGMKMHTGVDDAFGLMQSVVTTPANVRAIAVADQLPPRYGENSLPCYKSTLSNERSTSGCIAPGEYRS